jgi:carbonic anhydrase/acetyltransferase-like protein (isoleucine patch superfamily)
MRNDERPFYSTAFIILDSPFVMHPKDKSAPRIIKIHPTVFIAETATVIGDVTLGKESSVWFSAVLRGDAAPITIGEGTNVQDNAVIHVDEGLPTKIGKRVTIGHGAIVHAATVEDDVLIGMGCIILSGAQIGTNSIIAAGAVVREGMQVPPRSLVMGVPGKIVREVSEADIERIHNGAQSYIERAKNYWRGIYK